MGENGNVPDWVSTGWKEHICTAGLFVFGSWFLYSSSSSSALVLCLFALVFSRGVFGDFGDMT